MSFQPSKKMTLLMPSGPAADPDRLHLWIVLTDPCPDGANLLVNVSSVKPGQFHDATCTITAGLHPRIKLTSWVEYRRARAIHTEALVKGANAWLYRISTPISDELHTRICQGFMESEHSVPRLRRYLAGEGPAF
jgi:hypothetical protein